MGSVQRLEWNDHVERAVTCTVLFGLTALACRHLSHSTVLRPETRTLLRDLSTISGTAALTSAIFAYGLSLTDKPLPGPRRPRAPTPQRPQRPPVLNFTPLTGDVIYPVTDRKRIKNDECILSNEKIADINDLVVLTCNGKQYGFAVTDLLNGYKSLDPAEWKHPQIFQCHLTVSQQHQIIQLAKHKGVTLQAMETRDS